MDKSWMNTDRLSQEYEDGVESFCKFALFHATNKNSLRCPCIKCGNLKDQTPEDLKFHMYVNGIDRSYSRWFWHGEELQPEMDVDAEGMDTASQGDYIVSSRWIVQGSFDEFECNPEEFKNLLEDAEKPLYEGCAKFTKLSALVKMYNIKAKYSMSDQCFSEWLKLIAEMLPEKNEVPLSMYDAKKTLNAMGIDYEKIHACPNDCVLYRKNYKDDVLCPVCGMSRWKIPKNSTKPTDGIPAKVLWYFPPIPRFRRMFRSSEIAENLVWHASQREDDGQLRHPADAQAWKCVDSKWPEFASEPRNLRLALSADGINPHQSLSSKYSCWPVLLVTYNLPPYLSTKRKFIMLALLISGPNQPGNDIDVYLEPLIDDLKTLWDGGVEAYDAFRKEKFTLRAVLLWTINDFPAYGNLAGCKVKGYYACPICSEGTRGEYLKRGKKTVYRQHRRFLRRGHPYRRLKKAFNNKEEHDDAPNPLTGEEILRRMECIQHRYGKSNKRPDPNEDGITKIFKKKKSIFYNLEYWKFLPIRHVLDVMHIEKNIGESLVGTLLNIPGKTKDGFAARMDLIDKGLRTELAPIVGEKRTFLPPACYTLPKSEKVKMCKTLLELKVPEGYSSNFKNLVSMKDLKLYGLKSHDYHTLMKQILPVAIRSILPKHVRYAITRLCLFFNGLCKKVLDASKLDEMQTDLVQTLCLFEKYFPSSFFDIMVHLTVHLVREVKLCGPVYMTWMYPFERYMKVLKSYVRNRNRPEGCMAECYFAEEALEFCTEYLHDVKTVGVPVSANFKGGQPNGRPITGGSVVIVDRKEWEQAHLYVLRNTDEIEPYIEAHMTYLHAKYPSKKKKKIWLQEEHNRTFIHWLQETVSRELMEGTSTISENLRWLAHGPLFQVIKYDGYVINGFRFHTKHRDNLRVHQNSGVTLVANVPSISSAKDKNPVFADSTFYGYITEIWELDYNSFRISMFKCVWVQNNSGVKLDELGFTLVDLCRIGYKSDSFILAAQAKQVFYIEDQLNPGWSIVLVSPHGDYNEGANRDDLGDTVLECQPVTQCLPPIESFDVIDDEASHVRVDAEGIWADDL